MTLTVQTKSNVKTLTLWSQFNLVGETEITNVFQCLRRMTRDLNPDLTSLLLECPDLLVPEIKTIVNCSLQCGIFLNLLKAGVIKGVFSSYVFNSLS